MASTIPPSDPGAPAQSPVASIFANLARALRHRNYRLFFAGQLVSLIGTFLSQAAVMWMVYRLSHDAWVIGLVAFIGQFPMFAITPFAGVWVDRVNRRRLMIATQMISATESFGLLATAIFFGHNAHVAIPLLAGLSFAQGLANAFDMPGRQAFLIEMITDREDLPNAIALNSTMTHGARLLGPALAGVLIAWRGESVCFLLDGLSYLAVISALFAMRIPPRIMRPPRSVLHELREGIVYVWTNRPIRVLLLLLALISLTGMPSMTILMPVFGDHFGGKAHGAQLYGLLTAASGLGALCGALHLASRRTVVGLPLLIAAAATTFGIALLAFSQSSTLALSLPLAVIAGWGMFTNFATGNTILQTITEDEMRGRVMSFFSMAFLGMAPFGTLLTGFAAEHITPAGGTLYNGATRTFILAGIAVLCAAIPFMFRLPLLNDSIKPSTTRPAAGVLPAVADGLQAADMLSESGEE